MAPTLIGQTLAHFKITAKLGEGGMGAVWRAEDTKLGREVAIKVLPEAFADDPVRLARFEREAHVLASLNHPNIAGIYEVGEVDIEGETLHFLAMELAEGEDLSDYLDRGPLPPDEAVAIALQIAAGLEAAHEKGVVHRDLKPANVMISGDSTIKILDFGLAKAWEEPNKAGPEMSASPTVTAQMTQAGVIMGTLAYMSPEQARGGEADQRSDIWAFGVILWEMLTGQRMFAEPTVSDTLVAVLRAELKLEALPADTPWRLREVVELCLQRDSRDRLHAIADARLALSKDRAEPPTAGAAGPTPGARPWTLIAVAAALALVAGLLVGRNLWRGVETESVSVRLSMELEPMTMASNMIALSPDGRSLVYAGGEPRRLHRRPLDQLDAIPIPGTEDAQSPFFSPDGEWVAFFAGSSLKKVPLQGGGPVTLCEFPTQKSASLRGGAWRTDGRIFFAIVGTGRFAYGTLLEVSAAGGEPREVLSIRDPEGRVFEVADPQLLPGERTLLFTRIAGDRFYSAEAADLQALDLSTGEVTTVLEKHGMGRYLPSGHLLAFLADNTVTVAPFDPESLEITGPTVPIRDLVQTMRDGVTGHFAVAGNGTVAFQRARTDVDDNGLVWLGLDGSVTEVPAEPRPFSVAMVAPDGKRAIASVGSESTRQRLWLYDFSRRVLTALITDGGAFSPIWTPDGQSVIFHAVGGDRPPSIERIPAAGGSAEPLAETGTVWTAPWDVSPDGETLAFFLWNPETAADWDIRLASTRGGGDWTTFAQEPADEMQPAFSPDGNWIAFVSDRSGKREIFLKRFPEAGELIQVTDQGGMHPIWTPGGSRLLYLNADRSVLMAMDVIWGEQPSFGRSYEVLEIPPSLRAHAWFPWASLSPDGERLLIALNRPLIVDRLTLILDWTQELERLAPRNLR